MYNVDLIDLDFAPTDTNLVQKPAETNYERFWMNEVAQNSKDEKEFNSQAARIKLPASNEEDGPPPMSMSQKSD